jgi:hypothetical protein
MKIAKWIFRIAGIYGLVVMIPIAFSEKLIEQIMPPAVNHPEFFYGFVLLNISWQVLYLILARDPVQYRLMMLPAFLAKVSAPFALTLLVLQNRISTQWIPTAFIDGIFATLFVIAYWLTGRSCSGEEA